MSQAPTALDFHPPERVPTYWPWISLSALAALVAASLLPIWTVWYVDRWGTTADQYSLWKALPELWSGRGQALHGALIEYAEIILLTVVVGALFGALFVHSTRVVTRRQDH